MYNQLRAKILAAEFLPGETLSLRGMAAKFGVSLVPIREAVFQLGSEGILIIESNKRIQVSKLKIPTFKEILNLRLLLESEAIEQACNKRPKSAVAKVEKILEKMKQTAGVNPKLYATLNTKFHNTIYSYADSPQLEELIHRLLARVMPYIYLFAIHGRNLDSAMESHMNMFKGFLQGDGKTAAEALCKDLQVAGEYILARLKEEQLSDKESRPVS